MNEWFWFAASLAGFLLSHALPLRPAIRMRVQSVTGRSGFTILYSFISLFMLAWVIRAAAAAPYVALWPPANSQARFAMLAMAIALVLTVLAIGRPNAFSFGGGSRHFDPGKPGLAGWVRHPLLLAILLWSVAHIVANGDLAHVLLFGLFAGFALIGMKAIDRRRQIDMGEGRWRDLVATARRSRSISCDFPNCIVRLAVAAVLFAALLAVHPHLFGVSPLAASGLSLAQ